MIKAEDLRIGDLVKISGDYSLKGTIGKVSDIDSNKQYKEKKGVVTLDPIEGDDWSWPVWCCNIEPIPIDCRVFTKNGWKEFSSNTNLTCFSKEDCKIYFVCDYKGVGYNKKRFFAVKGGTLLKRIRSVHELQHMLKEFGENANLKI